MANNAVYDGNDPLDYSTSMWSLSASLQPPSSMVKVDIAGGSHRGHVRKNNEDHYLAVRVYRSLQAICTNVEDPAVKPGFEETGYGMVVADGMGGMAAGEVASRMALCKLVELVVDTPAWIMKLNHREDLEMVMQRMTDRFRLVDVAIREKMESNASLAGMGTTLTAAASLGAHLFIGHIGDSRAYLLRAKKLHQLTKDHTLAQALIDAGITTRDQPDQHRTRHVLTAALGSLGKPTDPQVQRIDLMNGDQVLLCTDGLTEMVKEDVICSALLEADTSASACQTLVDLALAGGGTDNVTVVLARYEFPPHYIQSDPAEITES